MSAELLLETHRSNAGSDCIAKIMLEVDAFTKSVATRQYPVPKAMVVFARAIPSKAGKGRPAPKSELRTGTMTSLINNDTTT